MDSLITQETFASLLQVGGQYLIPIAALLRALYAGIRGRLPEGFVQIVLASVFAALTALADGDQPDLSGILLELTGNTVFMAGLLAFIVVYLLRAPYWGQLADGMIGAVAGLIFWVSWGYLLGNAEQWWLMPVFVAGIALGFIVLRTLLRQIARLVKFAGYFIVAGVVLAVIGGGIYLVAGLLQTTPA